MTHRLGRLALLAARLACLGLLVSCGGLVSSDHSQQAPGTDANDGESEGEAGGAVDATEGSTDAEAGSADEGSGVDSVMTDAATTRCALHPYVGPPPGPACSKEGSRCCYQQPLDVYLCDCAAGNWACASAHGICEGECRDGASCRAGYGCVVLNDCKVCWCAGDATLHCTTRSSC